MKKINKLILSLFLVLFVASAAKAQLSISLSVGIAPPALPVYVQPACPTDGYLWVPGYWSYANDGGYFWVPGYWAAPPNPGLLWTPAYWGFAGGFYGFHTGYWGAHVGFYGGVNYGYGYGGSGFGGGNWVGGSFRYNTAVVNVNTTVVHNTYVDRTVINNVTVNNHTSFNGPGGVTAKPTPEERAAMKEPHVEPTAAQKGHEQTAAKDPGQFAKNNGGHPAAAAMNKIGGTPVNEHGKVATNSKLGNKSPNAARTPQKSAGANKSVAPKSEAKPGAINAEPKQKAQPKAAPQRTAQPQRPAQRTAQPQRPAQRTAPRPQSRPAPAKPAKKEK